MDVVVFFFFADPKFLQKSALKWRVTAWCGAVHIRTISLIMIERLSVENPRRTVAMSYCDRGTPTPLSLSAAFDHTYTHNKSKKNFSLISGVNVRVSCPRKK